MDEVFLSPDGRSHRGDLHRRSLRRTGPGSRGRCLRLGQYPETVRLGEAQHPEWRGYKCPGEMKGGSAVSPLRHQCHTNDEDQRGNHPDRGGQTGVDGHVRGGRREHSSGPPQVRPSWSLMTNESTLTIFHRSSTIVRVITSLRNQ